MPGRIDAQEARLQDLQRISVGYQQDVTAGVLSLQVRDESGRPVQHGELAADFEVLDCPAAFILGTGGHSGAPAEEMRTLRASVAVAQAVSQRVSVFATAPCNHTAILRKCPGLVVAAIKDAAGTLPGDCSAFLQHKPGRLGLPR